MAVLENWPPHYRAPDDRPPTGFAVDVMEAVADRVGLSARYVRFRTFPAAISGLRAGEVDVIPDMGIIPSRSDEFRFTRPFDAFNVTVLVRRSNRAIRTLDDLAGAEVGVVRRNVGVDLIADLHPEARPVMFESVRDALFGLLSASVDAVVYPEQVFLALARSADVAERIEALPVSLQEVPRAMAVRSADSLLVARLDRGIDALVGTPEFEAIYRRWFGDPPPDWTVERVAWGAGVLVLVIVVGMIAWRSRSVSRLGRKLERSARDRDETEAARRREAARFRTLVETAHEAIVLVNEEERVVFANQRLCDLLGISEDEILGRSAFDYVAEEDRERVLQGIQRRREGHADSYEVRLRASDGDVVWTIISAAPVTDESGAYAGVVITLTDITDRVRAQEQLEEREERFRAFVEKQSDLISTLDREGHMMFQSLPIKRLLGYEAEDLRGEWVFDYIHPEDRPQAMDAWERLLEEPGRTVELAEFRFLHKDGSWRIWETTLTNLLDDPAVGAVLANSRDVTERVELERWARQSQKLEAVGRLAGGVAHDFNNLLTVIRAHTDFLRTDPDVAEKVTEEVEAIRAAADRATELTNQLLAFSEEQMLRPRALDPNEVMRDVHRLVSRTLGEDIRIEPDLATDLPAIEVDPGQLDQVLLNLAVNARDAMPDGGTLTLATALQEVSLEGESSNDHLEPGRYVRLTVADSGVGMDEAVRARIFEPFFTTKGEGEGTGLGLAMAYGIVAQSGGVIRVESAPGEGSRFDVLFPAVDRKPEDRSGEPALAAPEDGATGRVLVVEDDASVRRVARRILGRAGFDVVAMDTAEAGLEALDGADGPFDVVLTDLVLPGMGGRELIDAVRERRGTVPLVAMSGYDKGSPGRRGELPPEVFFLQKPFSPDALVETIRQALARHVRDSSPSDGAA